MGGALPCCTVRRRPTAARAPPLTPPAQPGSGERLGLERFATSQDVVIVRVAVGKWQAIIHHDGERKPLGYSDDEQEAAQAFDAAARRLRGDDAHGGYAGFNKLRLNFPTRGCCMPGLAIFCPSPIGGERPRRGQSRKAFLLWH